MDRAEVRRVLARQCGVIARRQVLAAGGLDNDIQRLVRRREWARVFEGVYVDHTGPLTEAQRAWAAVLVAWPAALTGRDALAAHGLRGMSRAAGDPVLVVVADGRRVTSPPGVRVSRSRTFDVDVQHHLSPPRVRLERAALDVASTSRSEDAAVAVLSDACQTGRTTPSRLLDCLRGLYRVPHRGVLELVLVDVASGAYSALERRYLARVERAHDLPAGDRQHRFAVGQRVYVRDVTYAALGTTIELDGRLGHEGARDRWADMDRDIVAAQSGEQTLRVGWLQVVEAHRLAAALGQLLRLRGWHGEPRSCGPTCSIPK
ncbi:MAG: hypothetical protein ABIO16_12685 [Nocardioides sp.]